MFGHHHSMSANTDAKPITLHRAHPYPITIAIGAAILRSNNIILFSKPSNLTLCTDNFRDRLQDGTYLTTCLGYQV